MNKPVIADDKYYDSEVYSNDEVNRILLDRTSRFQKYRIGNLLKLYTPSKSDEIVDLGCGWGTVSFTLAPLCAKVSAIDFSAKSIELCKRIADKEGHTNIEFVQASAAATGLPDNSFDAVFSADLFEHIYPEDFDPIIKECNRILKVGGKFVIWTPNRGHFIEILKNNNIILKPDPGHVDYKSMKRIVHSLESHGFTVKKKYFVESHNGFSALERSLLPVLPLARRRNAVLGEKAGRL